MGYICNSNFQEQKRFISPTDTTWMPGITTRLRIPSLEPFDAKMLTSSPAIDSGSQEFYPSDGFAVNHAKSGMLQK